MTDYVKMEQLLVDYGMTKSMSKLFLHKLKTDEETFICDEETKKWAISKGFFPGRKELYNLNDSNFMDFIPDFNYFMLHPINNHFRIWISDKLTLKYTLGCNEFAETMPEYYLYIENNGEYTYLMDAPNDIKKDENFIINLVKQKQKLIIKPNSGTSGGYGVMKVEYFPENNTCSMYRRRERGGGVYINNVQTTIDDFRNILSKLRNNVVTEYICQHSALAKIWSQSECTLRVIMVKLPHSEFFSKPRWKCIVSYARFGSSLSGGASNLSSGGIGVGFDFETGDFYDFGIRYKEFCSDGNYKCLQHPDTKVTWKDNSLPHWEYIRDSIYKICNYMSSLDHLGFDVIISEQGFKLCEINTLPGLNYEQVIHGPLLTDSETASYFENKGLFNIDTKNFFDIYNKCQI